MNKANARKARRKAEKVEANRQKRNLQAKLRRFEKLAIEVLDETGEYPCIGRKVMKHRPRRNSRVKIITDPKILDGYNKGV